MTERKFPFYVVAIPDEYTILVNGGEDYNEDIHSRNLQEVESVIRKGDKLEVVIPGHEIIDPVTYNSLGYYDFVKETLEVIKVHKSFFECAKISKQKDGFINAISPMLGGSVYSYVSLNVDPSQIMGTPDDIAEITTGDPVKFIS